jgi:hypothetical protein
MGIKRGFCGGRGCRGSRVYGRGRTICFEICDAFYVCCRIRGFLRNSFYGALSLFLYLSSIISPFFRNPSFYENRLTDFLISCASHLSSHSSAVSVYPWNHWDFSSFYSYFCFCFNLFYAISYASFLSFLSSPSSPSSPS